MRGMLCHRGHAMCALSQRPCEACSVTEAMQCVLCHRGHAMCALSQRPCKACSVTEAMRCVLCHRGHAKRALSQRPCEACSVTEAMRCVLCHRGHAMCALSQRPCDVCSVTEAMRGAQRTSRQCAGQQRPNLVGAARDFCHPFQKPAALIVLRCIVREESDLQGARVQVFPTSAGVGAGVGSDQCRATTCWCSRPVWLHSYKEAQ